MKTTFLSILTLLVSFNAVAGHGSAKLTCASDSRRTLFSAQSEIADPGFVTLFDQATIQVDGYWYRMSDVRVTDVIESGVLVAEHDSSERLSLKDFSIGTKASGFRFIRLHALQETVVETREGFQFRARLVGTDPRPSNHPMKSNRGEPQTPETEVNCKYTTWN